MNSKNIKKHLKAKMNDWIKQHQEESGDNKVDMSYAMGLINKLF